MKKFEKRWFLISTFIFIALWGIFIFKFFEFYHDAFDFAQGESSPVIQLLLMTKYRGSEMIVILITEFVLLSLNLLNFAAYYFTNKAVDELSKSDKFKIIINGSIPVIGLLIISFNPLFMINVPLLLLSFVIVYVAYIIAKYTFGNSIVLNEEVQGEHGPFVSKIELTNYVDELEKYNDLSNLKKHIYMEEDGFHVAFYKNVKIGEKQNEE